MRKPYSHTPGPWIREGNTVYALEHHGWRKGVETFQNRFQSSTDGPQTTPAEEIAANARLIAAAPDLLEALRGVIAVADRKTKEFDAARAAIAKAEGE